ncbi:MAG TPA: DUF1295 domain-containing protein [Bacteroidales bacterium]|nr:DUF1295 domain-containing protein [Bacteroidales bacterium]
MLSLFLNATIVILILVTILWIWSIFLVNVSIVDIFWGIGFVVVNAIYFYLSGNSHPRNIILLVLVTLWGLRLAIYLGLRNYGKGEDFRYREFRKKYGESRYWWISYFQTFLLQAGLMMIISLPLLGANYFTSTDGLHWIDYLAIFIWTVGIIFEAGGDFQLARFKGNPQNKDKVLDTGLWRYTRHPNYFGDSAVWWAYGLFCIAAGSYWPAIGSIVMTLLIIKVSGVALLEKSLSGKKPEYREYIRKTSPFFPWLPKKAGQ